MVLAGSTLHVGGPGEGERWSVGLDVHARSVVACGIDGETREVFRAPVDTGTRRGAGLAAAAAGPVAVAYEAGPTGYGLARVLLAERVDCAVAAPSKLQRPAGDRVKTDARDARHLARLLQLDEIVPVSVPSVTQEAARDLVRAREDIRGDLMRRPASGVQAAAAAGDRVVGRVRVDR